MCSGKANCTGADWIGRRATINKNLLSGSYKSQREIEREGERN
jgi:hypothetical protein